MTRPGGQPGGSSDTGRWGGWALAPDMASLGRDLRSHIRQSQHPRRTFNAARIIFAKVVGRSSLRGAKRRGNPEAKKNWIASSQGLLAMTGRDVPAADSASKTPALPAFPAGTRPFVSAHPPRRLSLPKAMPGLQNKVGL